MRNGVPTFFKAPPRSRHTSVITNNPCRHPPLSLLPPRPSPSQIRQAHAQLVVLGVATRRTIAGHLLALCAVSAAVSLDYPAAIYALLDSPPGLFAANNFLRCLARGPEPRKALAFYSGIRRSGSPTNKHTYTFVLHGCSRDPAVVEGQQVHGHAVKLGLDGDLFIRNAMIHFYSSCGEIGLSRKVFDECPMRVDMVSWNAMIAGYARSGRVYLAEEVFDKMTQRDLISWSTIIAGYVQNGILEKALDVFKGMIERGLPANEASFVTVLSATAQLGLLEYGRFVHSTIRSSEFPMSMAIGAALVDMYAKCGCIDMSRQIFDEMPRKDAFAWNSMLCGLAAHGLGEDALRLFRRFIGEGLRPTSVTFVGVLNACSRAGFVDEGRRHFWSMARNYGIEPEMEHYGCIVDLLGRAGLVSEALELVENMKLPPDNVLWGTLLGACKVHGFVDLGVQIGRRLIELVPGHDGNYVLLANLYAKAQKWEDVIKVRRLLSARLNNKLAGWSLIESHGTLHKFMAGSRKHERSSDIYAMIDVIERKLAMAGYSPDVALVLHDIGEEEKAHAIKEHSERLAIAYCLMVTEASSPIRIVKNLRVCGDCHEFSKMVSKVFAREIIVRDGSRFHHFREGLCSCLDYW